MNPQELLSELVRLVESGDEAGIDAFIKAHLDEFPEEMKEQILQGLVTSAIHEEAAVSTAVAQMQEEAMDAIEQIESVEEEIENQDRIQELKATLGVQSDVAGGQG